MPKTGQTTSDATGDDGDLEKGVVWPNPRFTDHGNGTVTDNLTGLIEYQRCLAGARRRMKTSAPLNPLLGAPQACPGHLLFTLENLHRAYWACRRRKRGTVNALTFEADLEANLLKLHASLNAGTCRPRPAIAFLVEKPKRREIFAADFRDRGAGCRSAISPVSFSPMSTWMPWTSS